MAKKKHAEHVNHERWLVSYADLLTLLFAFFVVLFASSVSDKKKATKMALSMQNAFQQSTIQQSGIFDAHAAAPPLTEGAGTSQGTPTPIEMPLKTPDAQSRTSGGANATHTLERQAIEKSVEPAVKLH